MRYIKVTTTAMGILLLAGCSGKYEPICCDGGYEYRHRNQWDADKASADMGARLAALERERRRLADELAAEQKQNGTLSDRVSALEHQLADRDRELAALRSNAGDSATLASKLSSTTGDLDQTKQRNADLEGQLASAKQRNTDLERQLAALQSGVGDKDKLAADLAAAQQRAAALEAQLAGLLGASGDKDKLAADLAEAKQRAAALEAQLAGLQGVSGDKDKLQGELVAAKQRIADLEKQLAERDAELAKLRGDLSAEMQKLTAAQRGLVKALRPEIEKGSITVDLNNERLLINLASGYLFGSGEDQLKPAGADALKRVGSILKDYPEYRVEVAGHTDNRPIRSSLKKKFPTNKELSEARAANAVKALTDGGVSGSGLKAAGYADTKPVAPNATDAGRQKNRRVEVRVTPKS